MKLTELFGGGTGDPDRQKRRVPFVNMNTDPILTVLTVDPAVFDSSMKKLLSEDKPFFNPPIDFLPGLAGLVRDDLKEVYGITMPSSLRIRYVTDKNIKELTEKGTFKDKELPAGFNNGTLFYTQINLECFYKFRAGELCIAFYDMRQLEPLARGNDEMKEYYEVTDSYMRWQACKFRGNPLDALVAIAERSR